MFIRKHQILVIHVHLNKKLFVQNEIILKHLTLFDYDGSLWVNSISHNMRFATFFFLFNFLDSFKKTTKVGCRYILYYIRGAIRVFIVKKLILLLFYQWFHMFGTILHMRMTFKLHQYDNLRILGYKLVHIIILNIDSWEVFKLRNF